MDSFEKTIYKVATSQEHVYPKALAYFMFRVIIENAHSKYNISNEDIKEMCKEAVNRADMFLKIQEDPELYKAFAIWAFEGKAWDNPEMTDDLKTELEGLEKVAKAIR